MPCALLSCLMCLYEHTASDMFVCLPCALYFFLFVCFCVPCLFCQSLISVLPPCYHVISSFAPPVLESWKCKKKKLKKRHSRDSLIWVDFYLLKLGNINCVHVWNPSQNLLLLDFYIFYFIHFPNCLSYVVLLFILFNFNVLDWTLKQNWPTNAWKHLQMFKNHRMMYIHVEAIYILLLVRQNVLYLNIAHDQLTTLSFHEFCKSLKSLIFLSV